MKSEYPFYPDKIISSREICGWSAEFLAERSRLPLERYLKIESGELVPTVPDLMAIADALRSSLDYLAGFTWSIEDPSDPFPCKNIGCPYRKAAL